MGRALQRRAEGGDPPHPDRQRKIARHDARVRAGQRRGAGAMNVVGMSVRQLGEHIRKREVSPVEVAQTFLDRGASVGSKLNAYATLTRERALAEARAAEKEIAAGKYRGP